MQEHISQPIFILNLVNTMSYILNWPFHCSITIQLLDQKEGKDHCDFTAQFDDAPGKCTERRVGKTGGYSGWGAPLFICYSPKYLVNDSLSASVSFKPIIIRTCYKNNNIIISESVIYNRDIVYNNRYYNTCT